MNKLDRRIAQPVARHKASCALAKCLGVRDEGDLGMVRTSVVSGYRGFCMFYPGKTFAKHNWQEVTAAPGLEHVLDRGSPLKSG